MVSVKIPKWPTVSGNGPKLITLIKLCKIIVWFELSFYIKKKWEIMTEIVPQSALCPFPRNIFLCCAALCVSKFFLLLKVLLQNSPVWIKMSKLMKLLNKVLWSCGYLKFNRIVEFSTMVTIRIKSDREKHLSAKCV